MRRPPRVTDVLSTLWAEDRLDVAAQIIVNEEDPFNGHVVLSPDSGGKTGDIAIFSVLMQGWICGSGIKSTGEMKSKKYQWGFVHLSDYYERKGKCEKENTTQE